MKYKRDEKIIHIDMPLVMTYWNYFKYVMRHKFYVFIECSSRGLFLQGITHDLSKLFASEFRSYAIKFFSGDYAYKYHEVENNFTRAFLRHQNRNPHHWEYWVFRNKNGTIAAMEMPYKYTLEMVCDWRSACMAINGKDEVMSWYEKNKDRMVLHEKTRLLVEDIVFGRN